MGNLSSLTFLLGANIKDFQTKMRVAKNDMQSVGKSFQKVGKTMTVAITAPLAIIGGASLVAFDKQAQAVNKLSTQLQLNGKDVSEMLPAYKAFASELQNVTTVGDEATLQLMTLAESLQSKDAKQAAKDAIGLSKALGMDLNTAIKMVVLAQEGEYTMLNRYLPLLKTAKTETEKAAIANKLFADGFELAKTEAETGLGPLKQLGNTMGDLKEDFGAIISEAIAPLVEWLRGVVQGFKDLDEGTKKIIAVVAGLAAAVGPLLMMIGFMATNVIPGLITAFVALKGAFISLTTIIATNPIGALVTVLGIAAGALLLFSSRSKKAEEAQWKLGDAVKNVSTEIGKQIWESFMWGMEIASDGTRKITRSLGELGDALSEMTKGELLSLKNYLQDEYSEAARQAENATGGLLGALNEKDLEEFADALELVNAELLKYRNYTSGGGSNTSHQVSYSTMSSVEGPSQISTTGWFPDSLDTRPIEEMSTALMGLNDSMSASENASRQMSMAIKTAMADLAVGFGESLGRMIAGVGDMSELPGMIFSTIGNLLKKLGISLISLAVGIMAIDIALTSLNPYVAAAAGIALVALGVAITSSVKSMGAGMYDGGIVPAGFPNDTYMARLTSGEMVIPPHKLPAMTGGRSQIDLAGQFRMNGDDMLMVIDRASKRRERSGG